LVAFAESDVRRFALDKIITVLAPEARVISVKEQTRGAACTALLFAAWIDNGEELLIVNGNEFLDVSFGGVIADFRERELDAGVVVFPSIHPRYSFVRTDIRGFVVEAAEKKPISRDATAGFYWFARGRDFVEAAKNMIRKDARVNDAFYVCPSLNEMILKNARIGVHRIEAAKFHPLKTERQVLHYESQTELARR